MGFVVKGKAGIAGSHLEQAGRKDLELLFRRLPRDEHFFSSFLFPGRFGAGTAVLRCISDFGSNTPAWLESFG